MDTRSRRVRRVFLGLGLLWAGGWAGLGSGWEDLAQLTPGRMRAENALWIENALSARFNTSTQVTVAEIRGPAALTMIHFALPQSHFGEPIVRLGREVRLRMFWDGEATPSVDVPMVDFFCDPAGTREEVNTTLVNKRRGFNAYFPMPFRRSARVELLYDGPQAPGEALWRLMPCYSYVMYRSPAKVGRGTGYFHAAWRQEGLLLGREDYVALEAQGRGKFVGWNVSIRLPGREGYPVDANEKFYVDGESAASIEFQGLEDSFGFSWGFPGSESQFPLTGYYPFMKGAMAYRFFLSDAIPFRKSLRVAVGFGVNEDPMFRREFSKRGNALQLSSTVYWYQTEPHAPPQPMAGAAQRNPAPEVAFWPDQETLPDPAERRAKGVKLEVRCGRPTNEVVFAEAGYGAQAVRGYGYAGWALPVYYCRADKESVVVELRVPARSAGKVRVYVVDPDNFEGGRRQTVQVGPKALGLVEGFGEGRWLETRVGPEETPEGRVTVVAKNARAGSNAVISAIEWVEGE